jgi:hypothetical protein
MDCGAVMMCACDEFLGRTFLSRQLTFGTVLETQKTVPVTHGFVQNICQECRGLPVTSHPVSSIPGRTSKIKRYYWRELAFKEMELYLQNGGSPKQYLNELFNNSTSSALGKAVKDKALEEIKRLHEETKKYDYNDASTDNVLKKYKVQIENVHATYVEHKEKKAKVLDSGQAIIVEEYVRRLYEQRGYSVVFLESSPFHVLFGVYMWPLIQDFADTQVRWSGFGERNAYEERREKNLIWTLLPEDFGTPGYGIRRLQAINQHLSAKIIADQEDLLWLFDYWLPYSEGLRQYLWAHRDIDVEKARRIVQVLPATTIVKILRYLVESYWERELGWPDLLVYNKHEYIFVEVKSSKDKLTDEQKLWIQGNFNVLQQPFKILKIHRQK